MIVSIHQPAYIPWLGYFARIMQSDMHIDLDHVSFEKNSFINRNRVLTAHGPTWLTVPVATKGKHGQPIFHVPVANQRWQKKHWRTIQQAYANSPYLGHYEADLKAMYEREWEHLTDLLSYQYRWFMDVLDIQVDCPASCGLIARSHKSQLVLDLCKEVGATTYLSGPLGHDYLDLDAFAEANLPVIFDEWESPEYKQCYDGFEPNMSVLDLLFNHGPASREVILSGLPDPVHSGNVFA